MHVLFSKMYGLICSCPRSSQVLARPTSVLLQLLAHREKKILPSCSDNVYRCLSNTQNYETHRFYSSGADADNCHHYIPRRTLMYIPGHDSKKLQKIPKLAVDCAVLECEDGVAINMKEQARKNIRAALDYLKVSDIDLALRVNSLSSGLMEDDLSAIIGNNLGKACPVDRLPQTILLPKVDSVRDLSAFADHLQQVKQGQRYIPYLLTYVESAQGMINLIAVLEKAKQLTQDGIFRMDGIVFGSDDFCADIGIQRTPDAKELMYVRQKIVTIAKAFRLQAIDMVYIDIHDKEGLRLQSEEGARTGYTGKQVIHPGQLTVVEAAFTPSPAQVQWAEELIKAFEEHQRSGKGAFTFRQQMIDMPLLRQAKNVVKIVHSEKTAV